MPRYRIPLSLMLCATAASFGVATAQFSIPPVSPARASLVEQVNGAAKLSRTGDVQATTTMAQLLFRSISIPPEAADSLEFTGRLTQAELAYRSGSHAAVHEEDVVRAVNHLAGRVGAPGWAQTKPDEVRKLRMHMLSIYPQLMVSQAPPDKKGNYEAISKSMSPLEASYLACTLVFQKVTNEEYQFSDQEHAQYAKLGDKAVKQEHLQRSKALDDILRGRSQSVSLSELVGASEDFFSDLGVNRQVSDAQAPAGSFSVAMLAQGGR